MHRTMLKSKIHHATVTDCVLHQVASIALDRDLLDAADIRDYEQVAVLCINNGARFETHTVAAARGSRQVRVNGPAARMVHRGDTIIVISYACVSHEDLGEYAPRVVHLDRDNLAIELDGWDPRCARRGSVDGEPLITEAGSELAWRAA